MRESFRIGRLAGVPVSGSWSFLLVTVLLGLALARGVLPGNAPGFSSGVYLAVGLAAAVAFMAGVLAHEAGHAIVARRQGLEVEGITLWMLGGLTRVGGRPATPGAEAALSGVGPAVSLALGAVLGALAWVMEALSAPALAVASVGWLGAINLALAALNALPAAPLDGGSLLHAAVWRLSGDRSRATRAASLAGRLLGWVIAAAGLWMITSGNGGGIWLAVTGWFVVVGARAEGRQGEAEAALGSLTVAQVMTPRVATIPGWLTVSSVVEDGFAEDTDAAGAMPPRAGAVLGVEAWGGGLCAITTADRLASVPAAQASLARVAEVSWPLAGLPTTGPEEPATVLLDQIGTGAPAVLVRSGGEIVGAVLAGDVATLLDPRRAGAAPRAPRAR
ncbi:MAG: site-2 protease family protein, partial [Acidimicrobiales bacterium]